eukprot:CAMPEP_0195110402 /NCGR_PEP_ID=MMETSP0448-20130528/92556_1 /TAXON_ID=66468 /ORGANISM="Heterocapsa triquestra, Strain CCMP 448" /LENGTH=47 /DNA_ID= /DNA_START= /DNA_END= /DNA_ORIENTATION=
MAKTGRSTALPLAALLLGTWLACTCFVNTQRPVRAPRTAMYGQKIAL